jgi:abortive infection bacteriophage resistance protein
VHVTQRGTFYKNPDGSYIPGTNFAQILRSYEFDKRVRNIIFMCIEEIELSMRTKLSYCHAHAYGSQGYLESSNFNKRHNHANFIEQINNAVERNKNLLFVKHHIGKYNGNFPIWVVVELFSFGMLSRFYSDMAAKDQKRISRTFNGATPKNLSNWLYCMTILRNSCAHYARLYYRIFPATPSTPKYCFGPLGKTLFDYICVMRMLRPDPMKWHNDFLLPLKHLINAYADSIKLKHLGFPEDWYDILR